MEKTQYFVEFAGRLALKTPVSVFLPHFLTVNSEIHDIISALLIKTQKFCFVKSPLDIFAAELPLRYPSVYLESELSCWTFGPVMLGHCLVFRHAATDQSTLLFQLYHWLPLYVCMCVCV